MSLRIPKNQIKYKYTSGKEYTFTTDYKKEYQGYYYEVEGKIFAGKEFNLNNPEIIKIPPHTDKPPKHVLPDHFKSGSLYNYDRVASIFFPNNKVASIPTNFLEEANFYCKKITGIQPAPIKTINEETYLLLKTSPIYQVTYIGMYNGVYQSPKQAETQLPGISLHRDDELEHAQP